MKSDRKLTAEIIWIVAKSLGLFVLVSLTNPHRAIILPIKAVLLLGSWLAWRLEDGVTYLSNKLDDYRKSDKNPLFFKGLFDKSDKYKKEISVLVTIIEARKASLSDRS